MTATRPLGSRTGSALDGCYAASLLDCAGVLSGEHFISNALLRRFKRGFVVEGFPWMEAPKAVGPNSLTANVLCQRHNEALSPLDAMIARFYDALHAALSPGDPPTVIPVSMFEGEDLERWALKVMICLGASGNLRAGNVKARAREIPDLYLRILFGEQEMPAGCGLKMINGERSDLETNKLACAIETFETEEGRHVAFGISIRLLGFQFLTSITEPIEMLRGIPVIHRPDAFQIGDPERGRILLRWGGEYRAATGFVLNVVPATGGLK
jgi:hypothetical protein